MLILGSAYHPPDNIAVFIKKTFEVKANQIAFVSDKSNLSIKPTKSYYIFLSPSALCVHLDIINSKPYNTKVGIVCGSPLSLKNISGITPIDYSESEMIHIDAFLLNDVLNKDMFGLQGSPVSLIKADYVEDIVTKVQSFKGILTQFMTFIYTMPSSTHQAPIKELACSWLVSDANEVDLRNRFDKLKCELSIGSKKEKRFFDLLLSDSSFLYKKALVEAKNVDLDSKKFYDIVSKYDVSAYELRYILAINNKVNS